MTTTDCSCSGEPKPQTTLRKSSRDLGARLVTHAPTDDDVHTLNHESPALTHGIKTIKLDKPVDHDKVEHKSSNIVELTKQLPLSSVTKKLRAEVSKVQKTARALLDASNVEHDFHGTVDKTSKQLEKSASAESTSSIHKETAERQLAVAKAGGDRVSISKHTEAFHVAKQEHDDDKKKTNVALKEAVAAKKLSNSAVSDVVEARKVHNLALSSVKKSALLHAKSTSSIDEKKLVDRVAFVANPDAMQFADIKKYTKLTALGALKPSTSTDGKVHCYGFASAVESDGYATLKAVQCSTNLNGSCSQTYDSSCKFQDSEKYVDQIFEHPHICKDMFT